MTGKPNSPIIFVTPLEDVVLVYLAVGMNCVCEQVTTTILAKEQQVIEGHIKISETLCVAVFLVLAEYLLNGPDYVSTKLIR